MIAVGAKLNCSDRCQWVRWRQLVLSRAMPFWLFQFDAIRRAPDRVRREIYEFLEVAVDFKPRLALGSEERGASSSLSSAAIERSVSLRPALRGAGRRKTPAITRRSPRRSPSITYSTPRSASMSRSPWRSVSGGRPTPTDQLSPTGCRLFRLFILLRRRSVTSNANELVKSSPSPRQNQRGSHPLRTSR